MEVANKMKLGLFSECRSHFFLFSCNTEGILFVHFTPFLSKFLGNLHFCMQIENENEQNSIFPFRFPFAPKIKVRGIASLANVHLFQCCFLSG